MIRSVGGSSYAAAIARMSQGKAPAQAATKAVAKTEGPSFASKIDSAVKGVDSLQHNADDVLRELASGENVDIHGSMIALEKADIALRTMVSVRDKLVQAYDQVMNMAI